MENTKMAISVLVMNFPPGKINLNFDADFTIKQNSGSEAGMDVSNPLRREPRPRVGTTGIPVSNGRTMNDMISPPTPVSHSKTPRTPHSSVHSSPRINDQFGPPHQRKSRPPSTMTSPMSIDGAHNPGDHRPQRFRSLDERVSSLEAESRQHTDISGFIFVCVNYILTIIFRPFR